MLHRYLVRNLRCVRFRVASAQPLPPNLTPRVKLLCPTQSAWRENYRSAHGLRIVHLELARVTRSLMSLLVRASRIVRTVRPGAAPLASVQWRYLSGASEERTLCTPFISDTIPLVEGILGAVEELLKKPGDAVEELEVIATVETDKVVLDVRATESGVIKEVLVKEGEEVKEKQAIYTLE